jgi:hypothetical protein
LIQGVPGVGYCRKKLGHKLIEAMDEADAIGLTLTDQTKNVIRTLSPLHEDYTFRYRPSPARTPSPIRPLRPLRLRNCSTVWTRSFVINAGRREHSGLGSGSMFLSFSYSPNCS